MVNVNKKIIILVILGITIVIGFLVYFSLKDPALTITTEPKDAIIYIDNKKANLKNNKVTLKPGEHGILVEKKGFTSEEETVDLKRGGRETLKFVLEPYVNIFLPEENDNFAIEEIKENDTTVYQITLYAVFNRPDQLAEYKRQLKEYQKEALEWLKEKGVDTSKVKIKWIPEEKYFN